MALEGKSDEEIKELKELLTNKVKELSGERPPGNTTLIRELGWEGDDYWPIRNSLVDAGVLALGKGKGGSVRLIQIAKGPDPIPAAAPPAKGGEGAVPPGDPVPPAAPKESDLYDPMAKVLREQWTKDNRLQSSIVEITARQGKRDTGGTWTRPDITVIGYTVFVYLPGRHFDVATFEIKPQDEIKITGVYEALAHRRSATQAYVIYHVPDENLNAQMEASLDEICAEAEQHGVGVIVAATPDKYETWDVRVEASRKEPDPHKLNEFIAVQVSDAAKNEILKWFK